MNLCGDCLYYETNFCKRPFYMKNSLAPACFVQKKITNIEKIKNMSIEEMTEFLYDTGTCFVTGDCPWRTGHPKTCHQCISEWLESEAE